MKTIFSAITAVMVCTGTLAGCATPSSSGPSAASTAADKCNWPDGTKAPGACLATRKAPNASGITAASFGKTACPWPRGSKNPNFC
jgi:hypothetical protein